MSPDLIALIAGTLLAVGALAVVLSPLFFAQEREQKTAVAVESGRESSAISALREIEFDRATGKLSETDYSELRAAYAVRALEELRSAKDGSAADLLDPIEARVRAYRKTHRNCSACGLRPEPDAVYCSTCGAFLDRQCPACSAPIVESAAAFCSTCGMGLLAGGSSTNRQSLFGHS